MYCLWILHYYNTLLNYWEITKRKRWAITSTFFSFPALGRLLLIEVVEILFNEFIQRRFLVVAVSVVTFFLQLVH